MAIISDTLVQQRRDRRSITGYPPREVIGIMPQSFRFLNVDSEMILPQRSPSTNYNRMMPYDTGYRKAQTGRDDCGKPNSDVARMLPIWIAEYGTDRKTLEARAIHTCASAAPSSRT